MKEDNMPIFINPFTDFGFKRLFGQEQNKSILIGFLNALFEKGLVVKDLVYRDKEQLPESFGIRGVIFDVFCTTSTGEHFILEMQNKNQGHFEDRALYYVARGIVRQGKRGSWDYSYDAVIGIYFTNFTQTILQNSFRSDFGLRRLGIDDPQKLQVLTQKLRLVFLQMPLFNKTKSECSSELDKWMYIFKNMEKLKNIPWCDQEEFETIANIAKLDAMSEEERNHYDDALREFQDAYATHLYAKEEGLNKGKLDRSLEIAQSLLQDDCSDAFIAKHTGLSIEDIEKLRVSLNEAKAHQSSMTNESVPIPEKTENNLI